MRICNRLYINKTRQYFLLFLWLAVPSIGFSQEVVPSSKAKKDTFQLDSVNVSAKDTDSISVQKKQKPNQIDAEINYSARDSIVFFGNGTGFLHGESDIKYKKIDLKADYVRVRMDSSLVYARGSTDSVGTKIGEPVFSEGETEYSSRELTYNLKSKKGYIRQAVTQQGEGYIISDRSKKTSDDIICIAGGKYTTCDNHDHPDFYLSLSKAKVKPGGYIVTGPAHLVIQDVPLPIAIPFGFFPFTNKYSSGILMPTYTDDMSRGFGLTNGGYYFAISDYMDLEVKGDIYTKGTWALSGNSTYLKKYKYRGNLSVSYNEYVTGEKDLSNFQKQKNMKIMWSHAQDQKANPYFTFSSSVNFSTSGYSKSDVNSYYNANLNSENTKASSISFSQRFPESPFSLSGSMNVAQRTRDSTIDMTLPNLSFSVSRIYPLKRKNAVGKDRWYEKISMSYAGTLENRIQTKENLLLKSSFSRDWKNGMRHSIPLGATFNILKYVNISPAINYTERWYLQSVEKSWDTANQKVKKDTIDGFQRVYDFNMGISASTKLYGIYTPLRAIFGDKVDRIRHVFTPSVGFSYMPDFGDPMWGYYDKYTRTVADEKAPGGFYQEEVQYSLYEESLYGSPGRGKSGNINFSLANNLEMKVRNDKDTTGLEPFKKISLIDMFSVSGGYNLAVDTMQWSIFNTNLRIKLGKNYTLSLSAGFDPYMYGLTKSGSPTRINKLRWENGQFPRFLGTSTSYSYTLSNETFNKKKKVKKEDTENSDQQLNASDKDAYTNKKQLKENEADKTKAEIDQDGYEKVKIPWSIAISYSVRYSNTNVFDKTKMEYEMDFTHNLSLSGNIALTTNWKLSSSTSYDFKAKQFTYTNINVTRNLHCWSMTGSFVPFGAYKSYNFKIGVNASMLQDLKYDKQSSYGTNNITWY